MDPIKHLHIEKPSQNNLHSFLTLSPVPQPLRRRHLLLCLFLSLSSLVLHKVIKNTWPRVLVRVRVNITGFREVKKHIPRVLGDSPDLRMFCQVVQPLLQHLGRSRREHQTPQADCHVQRKCPQLRF